MAHGSCPHQKKTVPPPTPTATSLPPEPEMRRWRHPVDADTAPDRNSMHYIHCALAYQNQLLAEMKTLLEQIALQGVPEKGEK